MAKVAQQYPVFQPAMRPISAITSSLLVMITTSINHNYVTGEIVRIVLPLGFGMQQMNQVYGPITVTGLTTFTMPVDSTTFDPFHVPSQYPQNQQYAQVIPIGELSGQLNAAYQNVLPYKAT